MDHDALQSPESYSRDAFDRAERCAESAADAAMTAMLAWAQVRAAQERLRERKLLTKAQTRSTAPAWSAATVAA